MNLNIIESKNLINSEIKKYVKLNIRQYCMEQKYCLQDIINTWHGQ